MTTKVIKEAREHLHVICINIKKFRMCLPVQEDDTDEIFSRAFDYAEELEAEIKELRKELKFYGNRDNWSKKYIRQGIEGYQVKRELHKDGGERARKIIGDER